MRRFLALWLLLFASGADAATLTLPSITITNPPLASTSITCTQVTPLPFAPVASGTALFHCTVAPNNWSGTVALSGGNSITTSPPNGNTFDVIAAQVLQAGTYSPGTITSTP